jgi:tRNA A-37 threonylcarbamoyl transferase component Bud32
VSELFDACRDLDATERDALLRRRCAGDEDLRREVEALLADEQRAGRLFAGNLFETVVESAEGGAPLPEDALAEGTLLDGRYLIKKKLGEGGIGAVYLAERRHMLGDRVVVKVLLEESLRNEYLVQKFRQEMEALVRVKHPGVIGVIDAGKVPGGAPYLIFEYVEGEPLCAVMTGDGMDLRRAASIVRQIGEALTAAHAKGVFHRDLKPGNVMLAPGERGGETVKVIDFGVAKIKNSLVADTTSSALRVGTPYYMPPEQLMGRHAGAASDIYALGLIAYELITGRKPFRPESDYQLLEMQRAHAMPPPAMLRPALPEAAQEAILKTLRYDPRERYQNAADFGADFWAAVAEGETQPLPEGGAESARLPTARARTAQSTVARDGRLLPLAAGAAAAAVLLLLLLLTPSVRTFIRHSLWGPPPGIVENINAVTTAESTLALDYWREVQKFSGGKAQGKPFCLAREIIFERGYGIRLHFSVRQQGYLYIVNEGPAAAGAPPAYTLLFPDPEVEHGSAVMEAGREISVPPAGHWFLFDEKEGVEKVWLIYAKRSVSELEAVRGAVNPEDKGAVKNREQAEAIQKFIATHADPNQRPESNDKQECPVTTVRGAGETVIHLIRLEHR